LAEFEREKRKEEKRNYQKRRIKSPDYSWGSYFRESQHVYIPSLKTSTS